MSHYSRWLGLAALCTVLASPAARSENPKITVKIENATMESAAEQLGKAAGLSIQHYNATLPMQARPGAQPNAVTASFDWKEISLGKALRQLCEKFNLRPTRRAGGYVLYPTFQAPAAPNQKPVGLVEKGGYKLYLRSASMYESRTANFDGNQPNFNHSNLNLQLMAELGDGDGDAIAGIDNITAKDDLGNILTNQGRSYYSSGDNTFPDQWSGGISLPGPNPKAKKLLWLEGDLMVYRSVKPVKVELPLPYSGKSGRREVGGILFVVSRFQEAPKGDDDEDKDLPQLRAGGAIQARGPSMRVRVYSPVGATLTSRNGGWGMPPFLIGASGRIYTGNMNQSAGGGDGQMNFQDYTITYAGMDEPAVKVVWDLVEKSDPMKLFAFRMSDITLPEAGAFVPRKGMPVPAPNVPDKDPDHPFYEKGGGTILNRVQILDQPGSEGSLQLGLAPKTVEGWGPVRWAEVPLSQDGVARLEAVKPGVYRMVRRYRPKAGVTLPGGEGVKWLNEEVQITVAAAKEAAAPPLRWGQAPKTAPAIPRKSEKVPVKKLGAT